MPFDYLQTDDDLRIENGDFVVGESTQQHLDDLLRLKKGELRQYPKTGVGLENFLLDDNSGDVYQEIQRQFEADGVLVRRIDVTLNSVTGQLEVETDARYE